MSRKDYEATAAAIKGMRAQRNLQGGRSYDPITIDAIVRHMGTIFQNDNPRFSRDRFAAATAEITR